MPPVVVKKKERSYIGFYLRSHLKTIRKGTANKELKRNMEIKKAEIYGGNVHQ